MASLRERGRASWLLGAAGALVLGACSVGHGSGEITGTVAIEGCRREGRYSLSPTAFFAQSVENLLRIRVQRGSDLEVRSDGLAVLIEDASAVKRSFLGQDLDIVPTGPEQPDFDEDDRDAGPSGAPAAQDAASGATGATPVAQLSLYLNETCPPGRDGTPVVLSAVRGGIRFDAIYAPKVDKGDVQIKAELTNVRFEDPHDPGRWAELSGNFDFLYVRGSPAQRFP